MEEWDGKLGHPVCVLEPTRLCVRPLGHKGRHVWVSLDIRTATGTVVGYIPEHET